MKQYRKKPVTIEAVQFDGLNPTEIKDFVGENCEVEIYDNEVTPPVARIVIHTLEGDMEVSKGYYVIKGVKGEFYPCKPDIFQQTYESAETQKELEEAAEINFDEADALTEDYRDFLAKGLTENYPRPIGPHWFSEYAKKRFIAGADWQKEQMMKDAYVESQIVEDGRIELEGDPLPCLNPIILLPYPQFKPGDKVRIIVLNARKEE